MTGHPPKTARTGAGALAVFRELYDGKVACPWCGSHRTTVAEPFGASVSEILFRCEACENPFGWMKWEQRLPD